MRIAVVGLGYVGLPLAAAFGEAGHEVVGYDVDEARVARLAGGHSDVEDVPSEQLAALGERFRPTTDAAALGECEAILLCVPTPLAAAREPDLTYVRAAARTVAEQLREGQLVVLESTTYPGTTREELLEPLTEASGSDTAEASGSDTAEASGSDTAEASGSDTAEASGLRVGEGFFLAYSPERIDPGRSSHTIAETPKVVGGITDACTQRAVSLYEEICDEVVTVSSPEAAELSKLLENTFRSVNIALVNELAQLTDRLGIDIWEVVDAASTKPFGFMRFEPGPGMGGHCLPVDPFYLAYKARQHDFATEFVELAGKINQSHPLFCAAKVQRALNDVAKPVKGSRILILGVSYKAGVADLRESPALKIIDRLLELGAEISYHDPLVPALPELGLTSVDLADAADADAVAIVTAHPGIDYRALVAAAPLVIDFRGVTRDSDASVADNVVLL